MAEVNAAIITIGDELLIGQTIETNSTFIAKELNKIGIWVKKRIVVGDLKEDILAALEEQSKDCKLIVITGGLGPTSDDITKPALCEYFHTELVINEEVLQNVKDIFKRLNRSLTERNIKQAEVPANCRVLLNRRGTAPGMWWGSPPKPSRREGLQTAQGQPFEEQKNVESLGFVQWGTPPSAEPEGAGCIYISLPGVPHEMQGLMEQQVIPLLKEYFQLPVIIHQTIVTIGEGESVIADMLEQLENNLPAHIKLAYLPAFGMVKLRLTGKGTDEETLQEEINQYGREMQVLVKDWLVADEDITLVEVVGNLLDKKKKFVATAESCTGGYIAHLFTSRSGASGSYKGGVVSYANETKEKALGVQHATLAKHGAVSEETVTEMVKGVLTTMNADYALATSGIMGPDGGTKEKPVGTVWIAVASKEKVEAGKRFVHLDRKRNIELTAQLALNVLRKFILEQEGESELNS